MGLIFNKETKVSSEWHPAVAFIVLWLALIWLSMVEGGQASLVGLVTVNKELYKESHPITYKSTSITNEGDNLDRYLLGRQFMVVLIVFVINQCGSPLPGATLWGFPKVLTDIFLVTGLAMILFTCMIGQLNSQVNASHCMLDYINNYFAYFTLSFARMVEFSGIMHASYVVAMIVYWLSGKEKETTEPEGNNGQKLFFWIRCLFSIAVLGFSLAVTLSALFQGKTTMWPGVPEAVSVILFFLLMSVVGLLEGMQIAFFLAAKITKAERGESKLAKMTCDTLFKGKGMNLPGFMIGRQLCVVSCFFIIARVTTISVQPGESNIFNLSDGWQTLFNTGLLGAIITTILGSISWQLVASVFPVAFLGNPFTYIFLRICLWLEATGLCSGAWVLAAIHKKIAHFQRDEVYIGTAEERAAKNMADDEGNLHLGAGHLYKLPGFFEDAPESLKELMKNDPSIVEYIHSIRGNKAGEDVETGSEENELEDKSFEA
jgi:silicon transporter